MLLSFFLVHARMNSINHGRCAIYYTAFVSKPLDGFIQTRRIDTFIEGFACSYGAGELASKAPVGSVLSSRNLAPGQARTPNCIGSSNLEGA